LIANYRETDAMATSQLDPVTERARAGWKGFSSFIGMASLAIVVVLALLAIFLL
jgi:hypothetical protein